MEIKNILVVCVGNICRSPMAEYFFKQQHPEISIESAGISALVGYPANDNAQHCMQRFDIDMQEHVAKKLNVEQLKRADLVLVMSHNQQKHIEHTWAFSKGKVFRLGHWRHKDIPDPYQHDQAFFDEICLLIQQCVTDWKNYI